MIARTAAATLERLAGRYPVVALTGPRQSGKTTLARDVFGHRPYASLEDPDQREFALADPRAFLRQFPDGAVLDEAQRCPELFSYLQALVDLDGRMGLFILTGSQQFGLLAGITQSLAGRVATVSLLPFSYGELERADQQPRDLDALLYTGLYPPIHDRALEPSIWYGNYVQSYVERDVRQMVNVRDLTSFQRFVRLCAGRTGQLLNLSGLGADAGITHNTAKAWLSVLEASYIVHLLPPHHRNFRKRVVRTPKLYFFDTGLAAWLLEIRTTSQLRSHPLRGALFESWVVAELMKKRFHRGQRSNIYYWRDRSGLEVDVLIDEGDTMIPVEIKAGTTLNSDFFQGLRRWTALAGEAAAPGRLVYGGEQRQSRGAHAAIPWQDLAHTDI